jgi:hypothetical protein
MVEQARQYRSGDPNIDAFDKNTAEHRVARGKLRRSAQTDLENPVPLFISDSDGEPDPSEYIAPLLKKRSASILSRILAGVCAAAAVAIPVALFSSNATRDTVVKVRASIAAAFPAPSVAANSDPSQLTSLDRQNDPARPSAPIKQTPGRSVTTAAAKPAREELKMVYQSALQGGSPAADAVADPAPPADAIHHLDPEVISSLLRRADVLIASGDVAAARLVLQRAADAGDAGAAMALAGTYDPANLAKLGVHGIVPDLAMARSWYEKARTFGSAEARQRLEMLASKRQ